MRMQYQELKRRILELINQYSVAGETISPAYNNQSDYIKRIPGLINDALLRIQTECRPLVESCRFPGDSGARYGDMMCHNLPGQFRELKTGGVYRIKDGKFEPFGQYRLIGNNEILFPEDGNAEYMVEYYSEPEYLIENPHDGYYVDESHEVLAAACYYAAAMLVLDKNEYQYTALYNEFLRRMEGMRRQPTAEVSTIVDVYGW